MFRAITAKEGGATPADLIDLLAFALGMRAFEALVADGEVQDPDQAKELWKKAGIVANRYLPVLDEALDRYVKLYVERVDATAALKAAWAKAQRGEVSRKRFGAIGDFVVPLMEWFQRHASEFQDTFSKYVTAARDLQQAALTGTPKTTLAALARCPRVSRPKAPTDWVKAAAALVKVGPTGLERAVVEAQSLMPVVEEVREVNEKLRTEVDPGSTKAVRLRERRAALGRELEQETSRSSSPAVVGAAVASALSDPSIQDIQKRYRLDPEQAAIVLAKDRKIKVVAGAGSGKTHTVIHRIVHEVQKGMPPSKILLASFTNKAVGELEERLKTLGVVGVNVATTHRIAKQIAVDGDPSLRDAMNRGSANAKRGDPLLKLAVKQVEMKRTYSSRYASWIDRGTNANVTAWLPKEAYGTRYRYRSDKGRGDKSRGDKGEYKGQPRRSGGGGRYWKEPANEWFNLGRRPVNEKGRPIREKQLGTAFGLWQANMVSASEAWNLYKNKEEEHPLPFFAAATYGAYTWLSKRHDVGDYAPAIPLNEWISTAVAVLDRDPEYKKQVQQRFRFVAVDEAQDQNHAQNELFWRLGENADTLMVIGDDKQAIYGFRGAAPQEFVHDTRGEFALYQITTNYRSAPEIVEAANKLIAHNKDRQIPMVCRSKDQRRSIGAIKAVSTETHEDAAAHVAKEIANNLAAGDMKASDFGILVRNNAEADAYCLELVARGIPFRSKRDFFSAATIKNVLAWMTIAASSDDSAINSAVLRAHLAPGFFLNLAFAEELRRKCPKGMNYAEYLLGGGDIYYGNQGWRNRFVRQYANAIRSVREHADDATTLIQYILEIEGPPPKDPGEPAKRFIDALIEELDPEDVAEDAGDTEVTEDDLRQAALAPLQPLYKLAEKFGSPDDFLGFLGRLQAANENVKKGEDNPEPAVQVGTVHSWKGLEADHVYVSMARGVFPHFSSFMKETEGDVTAFDEERRLAYVAITRGRRTVTIMDPSVSYTGKESNVPNLFIDEACIAYEGEYTPLPSDGTDPSALRKEGSERTLLAYDFGGDIVACIDGLERLSWDQDFEDDDELEW